MYSAFKISAAEFREESAEAYSDVFGEHRPADLDRIDFALVAMLDGKPIGFVTCLEMDATTVYWQFGGAFTGTRGSTKAVGGYIALVNWCLERYERITTRIENENVGMLHLAMRMGFRVAGVWNFKNKVFVEMLNEGAKDGRD